MNKPILLVGVEFECAAKDSLHIEAGDYHRGNFVSSRWIAEEDSSLGFHRGFNAVELISVPIIYTKTNIYSLFDELRNDIFEGLPFDEAVKVDSSCGQHLHVSCVVPTSDTPILKREYQYNDEYYIIDKEINNPDCDEYCGDCDSDGCDCIDRSESERWTIKAKPRMLPLTFPAILKIRREIQNILPDCGIDNYERNGYCDRVYKGDMVYRSRGKEWNPISDNHAEFRSFNMNGVQSWEEFTRLHIEAFDIIQKNLIDFPIGETETITI